MGNIFCKDPNSGKPKSTMENNNNTNRNNFRSQIVTTERQHEQGGYRQSNTNSASGIERYAIETAHDNIGDSVTKGKKKRKVKRQRQSKLSASKIAYDDEHDIDSERKQSTVERRNDRLHYADDTENSVRQIEQLRWKLQQYERLNNDLSNRLSALASAKLRDNNADIADLSDQNRPGKLAEKFSELYDNEWTAAFEDIENQTTLKENQIVKDLLNLIKIVYERCVSLSRKQMDDLKNQIELFTGENEFPQSLSYSIKIYKDERKKNYKTFLPTLAEELKGIHDNRYDIPSDIQSVDAYIEAATELCWLMCIQDPPIVMYTNCRKGSVFDGNIFKGYTKTSKKIQFLVWPALYLHENGQLLSKGVAQGKRSKKQSLINKSRNKDSDISIDAEKVSSVNQLRPWSSQFSNERTEEDQDKAMDSIPIARSSIIKNQLLKTAFFKEKNENVSSSHVISEAKEISDGD